MSVVFYARSGNTYTDVKTLSRCGPIQTKQGAMIKRFAARITYLIIQGFKTGRQYLRLNRRALNFKADFGRRIGRHHPDPDQ